MNKVQEAIRAALSSSLRDFANTGCVDNKRLVNNKGSFQTVFPQCFDAFNNPIAGPGAPAECLDAATRYTPIFNSTQRNQSFLPIFSGYQNTWYLSFFPAAMPLPSGFAASLVPTLSPNSSNDMQAAFEIRCQPRYKSGLIQGESYSFCFQIVSPTPHGGTSNFNNLDKDSFLSVQEFTKFVQVVMIPVDLTLDMPINCVDFPKFQNF